MKFVNNNYIQYNNNDNNYFINYGNQYQPENRMYTYKNQNYFNENEEYNNDYTTNYNNHDNYTKNNDYNIYNVHNDYIKKTKFYNQSNSQIKNNYASSPLNLVKNHFLNKIISNKIITLIYKKSVNCKVQIIFIKMKS